MGAYFLYNIYVAFYENKSIVYIIKMDCGKNVSHYFSRASHFESSDLVDIIFNKCLASSSVSSDSWV